MNILIEIELKNNINSRHSKTWLVTRVRYLTNYVKMIWIIHTVWRYIRHVRHDSWVIKTSGDWYFLYDRHYKSPNTIIYNYPHPKCGRICIDHFLTSFSYRLGFEHHNLISKPSNLNTVTRIIRVTTQRANKMKNKNHRFGIRNRIVYNIFFLVML